MEPWKLRGRGCEMTDQDLDCSTRVPAAKKSHRWRDAPEMGVEGVVLNYTAEIAG